MKPEEKPKKIQHPALEMIEEAMKRGEFDNLPGKGKPLPWDATDLTDPLAAAAKVRQNAEVSAPWQNVELEIAQGLERARREVLAAWQRYQTLVRAGREEEGREVAWQKAVNNFHHNVEAINSRILTFNIMLPRAITNLQKPRVKPDQFLLELGIDMPQGEKNAASGDVSH